MNDLGIIEIKAFVPARDFELSKKFYSDLGFECKSSDGELAYFCFENTSFLLQNFFEETHANNFMMHMLVKSADAWRQAIDDLAILEKYDVKITDVEDREWGMRDFAITDPSGVLWRIGHNI